MITKQRHSPSDRENKTFETRQIMSKVTSKDGTQIAYERQGAGPAVILVDGALGYRSFSSMTQLAELLAPHFTAYAYDRRGRGESGNSRPYALEREIEDIDALVEAAGGSAFVYGISSGACLALEAAMKLGPRIGKLAMYEPPYNSKEGAWLPWKEYREKLAKLLADDRRGEAVALFMRFVGTPADMIDEMRQARMWPMLEAVAPTLLYDTDAIGEDRSVPVERAANITVPTLVMDGGANLAFMPFMHETANSLAQAIPHAQHRTLEDQTHDVNLEVLAPVLVEFFTR
jgi:pimeloyl-ACP methyl ester carboxylesterase